MIRLVVAKLVGVAVLERVRSASEVERHAVQVERNLAAKREERFDRLLRLEVDIGARAKARGELGEDEGLAAGDRDGVAGRAVIADLA